MTAGDVKPRRRPTRCSGRVLENARDQFRDGLRVSIVKDICSIKAVGISTLERCRHKSGRGEELLRVLRICRARDIDFGLREQSGK